MPGIAHFCAFMHNILGRSAWLCAIAIAAGVCPRGAIQDTDQSRQTVSADQECFVTSYMETALRAGLGRSGIGAP